MEVSGYDIILRKFHRGAGLPEFTDLTAEDLASHKAYMKPLIKELTKGGRYQAMMMERCFERFSESFRWD